MRKCTIGWVLGQMRATNVLGVSRMMAAKGLAEGQRRAEMDLAALQEYAALLGEERGLEEAQAMEAEFAQLQAAPAMAKMAVSGAFARQRSTRPFRDKS